MHNDTVVIMYTRSAMHLALVPMSESRLSSYRVASPDWAALPPVPVHVHVVISVLSVPIDSTSFAIALAM